MLISQCMGFCPSSSRASRPSVTGGSPLSAIPARSPSDHHRERSFTATRAVVEENC